MPVLKNQQTAFRHKITIVLALGILTNSLNPIVAAPIITESVAKKFDLDRVERLITQHLSDGQFEKAAKLAATQVKHLEKDDPGARLVKMLALLSKTEIALGDYQSAQTNVEKALLLTQNVNDKARTASLLSTLAHIAMASGSSEHAEQYLNKAMALIESVKAPGVKAVVLNNLGNYLAFQGDEQQAISHYQESTKLARQSHNIDLAARALANHARVVSPEYPSSITHKLVNQALEVVQGLDDSHSKAYLLMNLARTLTRIKGTPVDMQTNRLAALNLLTQAQAIATAIHNPQAQSYAWGYLGELYEKTARHAEALQLTQRAIFYAQQMGGNSDYLLFSWYWQVARQHQALADRTSAIQYYRQAISLLQTLRYQKRVSYQSKDRSIRETANTIYFQLVDLLLQQADETSAHQPLHELLKESRDTLELLKAAEIRNYFDDNCVDAYQAKKKKVEQVSHSAAIIYPILLHDRVEILVNFPGDQMRRYRISVDANELSAVASQFRQLLEKRSTYQYRKPAQTLYRWLVKPYLPDLAGINTLVFVPDRRLNNIPMAALFDGQQHLISQFAVVSTPGIELTDPQPLYSEKLTVVSAGLSEAVSGFSALQHVPDELKVIQQLHGGEMLLNKTFLKSRLEKALYNPNVNVLHISTHAEFKNNAADSYLLTYNGKLTLNQLSKYIGLFKFRETPLELLVLSACETARGDDQAALGLSGIAIKAGARSAIGSLWKVNDAATSELISEFYRQLQMPDASRASALQQAQLKLINDLRYRHPNYWSAFLLLNNWL